jgi:hypothetical protein
MERAAQAFSPPATDAAPAASDATSERPALPSTPEAPATEAVLAKEESASTIIRQRNELADARKALDAERAHWRKEQAEHKARMEAMERAFSDFEADPAAFAKAKGGKRTLIDLARDLYIEDAEIDKLPPEQAAPLKAERELMRLRREQQKMHVELEATRQEHRLAMYRGQLSAGLAGLGDETPLVKALAATDPQMVVAQMERVAGELAQRRPDLGIQSAGQLATILEPQLLRQLEDTATRFKGFFEKKFTGGAPAAAPTSAAKAAPKPDAKAPPEKTLSRDLQAATPARTGKLSASERMALAVKALEGQA